MGYVILYLAAIVLANILTATFGPGISIVNAFFLVGLDLTTRDALHSRWESRFLALRMFALITAGSALTWLLNRSAGPIALASMVAFAVSAVVDTIIYHLARRQSIFRRMALSNLGSSAADSILFPWLAFGGLMPGVTLGQFLAKFVGGYLWAYIIWRHRHATTNRLRSS